VSTLFSQFHHHFLLPPSSLPLSKMQTPVREYKEPKLPMHNRRKQRKSLVSVPVVPLPMDFSPHDAQSEHDMVQRVLEAQSYDGCSLVHPSFEEDEDSRVVVEECFASKKNSS